MKLVIDIPEEKYGLIVAGLYCGVIDKKLNNAIKNGTPLPNHGRLVDADEVKSLGNIRNMTCTFEDIDEAPTIIEADKGEKNESDNYS